MKSRLLLVGLLWFGPPLYAAGLSTPYGEIRWEQLPLGRRVLLTESLRGPFTITNTGDTGVELKLELLSPEASELKTGYEPLPDLSWVTILTETFTLSAQGIATTDLAIAIPDEPAYRGKRYQCYLWAHTVGASLGVGLKSRLLIAIADELPP